MTQDFAKPSTTRKPGEPAKKTSSSGKKSRAGSAKSKNKAAKKPSGASPSLPESNPSTKKSKAPFFVSLFLLLAAFSYGIYFLQNIPPTVVDEQSIDKAKENKISSAKESATPPSKQEEKRFNFYDILPKSTVTPPKVEEYRFREKAQSGEFSYTIQTGSFRSKQDAERQKAMIALQGLKTQIRAVTNDQGTLWYRVETDAFNDRSKLNSALDKLVSINIEPLVKKVKR